MEDDETEDVAEAAPPSAPISDIVLRSQPALGSDPGEWFVERARYIPLRLTLGERKYLRYPRVRAEQGKADRTPDSRALRDPLWTYTCCGLQAGPGAVHGSGFCGKFRLLSKSI